MCGPDTHTLTTPVRLARMDTERVVVDALRNEMTILLEIAVAEPLPADHNRCGCPSCHDRSVGRLPRRSESFERATLYTGMLESR